MASLEKRGRKYLVRWRDPDGSQRTRTAPDHESAKALRREVERASALGHRWEPPDARAFPALIEVGKDPETGEDVATGGLFTDFLEKRRARLSPGTRRHYDRALHRYVAWLAERNPRRRRLTVDLLTRDSLEGWFGTLVDDRLPDRTTARAQLGEDEELCAGDYRVSVATARLYVTAVWQAWSWGFDSDDYGDNVTRPRRPDLPAPSRTPVAAPTWAQMDACIGAAWAQAAVLAAAHKRKRDAEAWVWRARLLTFLRFTGLRVDLQAMHLRWSDVDLDERRLVIRGELGKSERERQGREIPLSPHLCEIMAGWGKREGYLLAPHLKGRTSISQKTSIAWEQAVVGRSTPNPVKVPERVWAPPSGRVKGQPHHAFRKGFKTGLSELGVGQDVRDYLLGHNRGIDEHYLDTWRAAQEAVGKIPPLSDDAAAPAIAPVIRLPGRR